VIIFASQQVECQEEKLELVCIQAKHAPLGYLT
jgi:hypothetical protein